MQIPILNGVYADTNCNFRASYPVNLMPIFDRNGISDFYLKPSFGLIKDGDGPGLDRGGINWNGNLYRVMGTSLVRINEDSTYSVLGDVGGYGQVTFAYSFDRLAIVSSGLLYYLYKDVITQVTDVDLGIVLDLVWIDGYFLTTDGDYLIVTELNDPASVNPLKYGSSEADPDKIVSLVKIKNELCVLNRYSIEFFDNVGGSLFPFARIESAQIQKGCVGTHAACVFMDVIAFLGGYKNEPCSVWLGLNGTASKISTNEIDRILISYTEDDLKLVVFETMLNDSQNLLFIHLKDRTLVYDGAASLLAKQPVWFYLSSSVSEITSYRSRNLVWCYNKWCTADPTSTTYGHLSEHSFRHYGQTITWEFSTGIAYNNGKGCLVNSIELVYLKGLENSSNLTPEEIHDLGSVTELNQAISTQYSDDGLTWSFEKFKNIGSVGDRNRRLMWLRQGRFSNWRIQKFKGDSSSFMAFIRLEVELEGLYV